MKVLLSWLRELAALDADPERIRQALDDLGTPVEDMARLGEGWDGIVTAKVVDLRPHPNADRIQLVDVDTGGDALQICCGAFNMAVGDVVPLATVGTTMPGGMRIERRKLRGEWSNGMLCSTRELGLGDEHGGIRILDGQLPVGVPLAEALGVEPDVLYDLEVNPNRPDAMSVAGIARDLAAHFGVPFTPPSPSPPVGGAPAADAVTVEVLDPDACGRFGAWVLRGVDVAARSPEWVQRRLTASGMRPINALVDISNYVMLELGQPNHPYDLAKVRGGGLRVRRARDGETLVTLDGVERTLTADDLLICDATDAPVGIAGVMGGASSEIDERTTEVLLEMAWFLPSSVSRTSRRLGLRSEASARFEKGCDPEVVPLAAARFCELAAQICGATTAPGAVDVRGDLPDRSPVRVRTGRVNALLGTALTVDDVRARLEPIGFACTPAGDAPGDLDVVVPPFRYDATSEIDVVEEVARHCGYRNIPVRELSKPRRGLLTVRQKERRAVRRLLMGLGLAEVLPLPFLAPGDLERCGLDPRGIELVNPMAAEESVLRTSLLPGMVKAVALNAARRSTGVRLFEIGHVFLPPPGGQVLPDEREHLGVVLAGQAATAAVEVWQVLAEGVRASAPSVVNAEVPGLHPTRAARLLVEGRSVGVAGEIDPGVLGAHGVDDRVAWLEVDLGALLDGPRRSDAYRPVSRFPSSDVDLAFEVPDEVSAFDVERTLAAASDLVWSVRLFDVYRAAPVAEGARSLAYAVRFQAPDRTLTDAEVAEARQALIDAVVRTYPATLRA